METNMVTFRGINLQQLAAVSDLRKIEGSSEESKGSELNREAFLQAQLILFHRISERKENGKSFNMK